VTSPTFSSFASNAFLPSRGMHFDGSGATRVYDWKTFRAMNGGAQHAASTQPAATQPASTQPVATQPGSTQPAATQAPPTTAGATQPTEAVSQGVSSASAAPTTASGYLRPGSIDQNQFKAMLAAASLGTPGKPAAGMPAGTGLSPMPAATGRSPLAPVNALAVQQASTGLPMPGAAVANGQAPAIATSAAAPSAATPLAATPGGAAIPTLSAAQFAALTGVHLDEQSAAGNGNRQPATAAAPGNPADHGIPPDALTMTDAAIPPDAPPVALDGQAAALPSTDKSASDKSGDDKDEDGVLKLTQIPDRETRQEYAAKGIKWKLVDDPAADRLFFGPDGKLSWDDAVDLINPLQHIPGINILYRQLTGDKISGAAELLGAIPFGPLSTLGAVVNLAVKSTSGRDIGDNLVAMLTGEGKSETKTTDLAAREPQPAATAATGETAEIAGETAGPAVPAEVELASAYSVRDHTYGRG